MGTGFVFTVFTLFGIYRSVLIMESLTDPKLQFASVLLVWAFYFNGFVIGMLSSGSAVRYEVN